MGAENTSVKGGGGRGGGGGGRRGFTRFVRIVVVRGINACAVKYFFLFLFCD